MFHGSWLSVPWVSYEITYELTVQLLAAVTVRDDLARARVAYDTARALETVDGCQRACSEMGMDAFLHATCVGSRVAEEGAGNQDNFRVGTCYFAERNKMPTTVVSTDQ